jgi:hypothetical protein
MTAAARAAPRPATRKRCPKPVHLASGGAEAIHTIRAAPCVRMAQRKARDPPRRTRPAPHRQRARERRYVCTGVPMKSRLPSSTPQWRRMS